jgi:hypothetical protein
MRLCCHYRLSYTAVLVFFLPVDSPMPSQMTGIMPFDKPAGQR